MKLIWAEGYYILTNILEPIIPHACWELSNQLFNLENFNKKLEVKMKFCYGFNSFSCNCKW